MVEIDKTDRKILSILQADGRIANVELAERIGLSPTSIGERLKRLQREGVVEGYGARLNPHRLGLGLLVFVEVLLDKTTPDNFERFARAVKLAPEVLECHMVAGGFDYLVKARLADMTAYRRFLGGDFLWVPGGGGGPNHGGCGEIKGAGRIPGGSQKEVWGFFFLGVSGRGLRG